MNFLKKYFWLILATLISAFVLAEGFARQHPAYLEHQEMRKFADALLEQKNGNLQVKAGASLKADVLHESSEWGTRGAIPPEDDLLPLVVVTGDSHSWGLGEPAHVAWPLRTQHTLGRFRRPTRIINASIPFSAPSDQVAQIRRFSEHFNADVFMVGHSFHEARIRRLGSSLALPVVLAELISPPAKLNGASLLELNQEGSRRWRKIQSAYEELGSFCQTQKLQCVVTAIPPGVEGAKEIEPAVELLEQLVKQNGLHFIDATGLNQDTPLRWVQGPDDPHPNEEGHERIALLVANYLRSLGLLPPEPEAEAEGQGGESEAATAVPDQR